MGSVGNLKFTNQEEEEEDCLYAIQLISGSVISMVLQTAVDLDLFQTMAKAGNGVQLSPSEIASLLKAKNPDAPMMLDRILRLLTSYKVLTSSISKRDDTDVERLYGLAPVCKYFVSNEEGHSFASWIYLNQNKTSMKCWPHLKDAVLEGGNPFTMAHGMHAFDYSAQDPEFNDLFNRVMFNNTSITLKKVIEKYKGFEGLKELVDVGGGLGTSCSIISSMYPYIKCINYDLPHVIVHARPHPCVEHIGGNIFESVPKGETIMMKWILHNWDDEHCTILLKNCYEALPDHGKIIVVDAILPEEAESNTTAKGICQIDLIMMVYCPTGKERTEKEFEALAKGAGFAGIKIMCRTYNYSVMEFYKKK